VGSNINSLSAAIYFYVFLHRPVFLTLVISFPTGEFLGFLLPENIGFLLGTWGWYSLVGVAYTFFLLLIIDMVRLFDRHLNFIPVTIKKHKMTPLITCAAMLAATAAILAYGTWNARNPVLTEYDITVDKKAGSLQDLRIAMVSDIHYGQTIDLPRLDSLAEIISKLRPDIILIAGDITNGSTSSGEALKLTDFLRRIPSKYGIYAVTGNHDRELRNKHSELSKFFEEAGITVLRNCSLKIGDNFYLIGRNWPQRQSQPGRKELEDLTKGLDTSLPLIVLDQQPPGRQETQSSVMDLQLSGHTHVGQVFPINLITGYMYDLDWGLLQRGNHYLIVSSGYGTWGPPLRLGNHPEVVGIDIKFKQ